jgi:predicted XRE-type DNA-binding protein
LEIPGFPETEDDAKNTLSFVRSQREECEHLKSAAEAAVHQCILQLQICQQTVSEQLTIQRISDLARRRNNLVRATEALLQAERRIGHVRTLLRTKGLPVVFSRHDDFRSQVSNPSQFFRDSNDDNDLVENVSDGELEEGNSLGDGEG